MEHQTINSTTEYSVTRHRNMVQRLLDRLASAGTRIAEGSLRTSSLVSCVGGKRPKSERTMMDLHNVHAVTGDHPRVRVFQLCQGVR